MFSNRIFTLVIVIITLTISTNLFSQTEVEGDVSGVWDTDGSPYIAVDDIRVPAQETLRVEPGVSILFARGTTLLINGLFTADGVENDLITFSPQENGDEWFGIDVIRADDDTRFSYCVIEGARAPGEWDDVSACGGGIYCSETNITILNSIFRNNDANDEGGGAYISNCDPIIENNIFIENSGNRNAGAIYFLECEGEFNNNWVEDNHAVAHSGGGVFLRRSSTRIAGNRIFRNRSNTNWGSGLYMDFNCSPEIDRNLICQNGQGGIFMGVNCESASFMHNTIANNQGRTGILLYDGCTIMAVNCIIYGNLTSNSIMGGCRLTLDYTDIENPDMEGVDIGEGVIDQDPMFFDVENDNFSLFFDSPCVDAGDPESPRDPDNSIADLGALYFENAGGEAEIFVEPDFLIAEEPGDYIINITNESENPLWWRTHCNVDWITCTPDRMVLDPESDVDVLIEIRHNNLDEGVNHGEISIFSNDPDTPEIVIPVQFMVGDIRRLSVSLDEGWNYVSLNIEPFENLWRGENGPDVELLFDELRIDEDQHHVVMVKNEDAQFWVPRYNYNQIPFLDLRESWEVQVDENVDLDCIGFEIRANASLVLRPNWNYVAYYPTYPLDASEPDFYVLSPIIGNVTMAKDCDGNFLAPEREFSNMPPWREGCGYKIKVDQRVVLRYPPPDEERLARFQPPIYQNSHWDKPRRTGDNMSLLVKADNFQTDIEIAAFTQNGVLVGSGRFNQNGMCGMALWGDDQTTSDVDGLQPDEHPVFKIWDGSAESTIEISISEGSLNYEVDAFTFGDLLLNKSMIADDFEVTELFPNPFNNETSVSFSIPESGIVNVNLYDLSGRELLSIFNGGLNAGVHRVLIESGDMTSGVYLLKINFSNISLSRKVVLIR